MRLGKVTSFVSFGAVAALVACSAAPPTETSDDNSPSVPGVPQAPSADGGGGAGSGGGGATPNGGDSSPSSSCGTDDYVKPDLSTLTACGSGKGHCYDKTKVPLADQMTACTDASQVCVPDDILEADGSKPKGCTSIVGPGGCVTASLFPEIEKQGGGALKQDVCDAGQLCVPCTDPTHNNAPTPFCQPIGVHKNACGAPAPAGDAGGAPLPACCTSNGKSHGVCLPDSAIPASQQSSTSQQECATGNKCVPAAFVAGTPVKCDSGLFGSGVCMDGCFNSMLSIGGQIGLLSSKGCDTSELCIPCSFVSGQGVPGCGQ